MLWSLGKKSILKCCLPTIARFWQPLRYIHVTSTYKNILFDKRKSDDFNKLIWRIPASPNTDRFLWRWFHRKAQDPTKATNWNNHNVHKNYMKWLVQSNLQVILVIQWMYHYNLGRMTRNPTRRKTSSKVSYEPLYRDHQTPPGPFTTAIGINRIQRGMIHVDPQGVILDLSQSYFWVKYKIWSPTWSFGEHFPSFSHQFCWDSLILSIFQSPRNGGSLGSQSAENPPFPLKEKTSTSSVDSSHAPCPHLSWLPSSCVSDLLWNHSHLGWSKNHRKPQHKLMSRYSLENDPNPTLRYEKCVCLFALVVF